ncbi:MAG: class I SAM-dependent methyltransferase [candidate division Zixibacteria bacterium]
MNIRDQMDKIYRDIPPENIPWNISESPELLINLFESGKIKPGKIVDLGCGVGNYSIWLAQKGFDVTGIDISQQAINLAMKQAENVGIKCRFFACDLLGDLKEFHYSFDFAMDWEVLHHIFPEDRPTYMENVHKLLKANGQYFTVCFSEEDKSFGTTEKYRETPLGTTLYFSSEQELRELYKPFFKILEMNTVEIPGKFGVHTVIASLSTTN